MRHGAFPAVPEGQKPIAEDDLPAPIVRAPDIAWKSDDWHHVVLTWSGFDTGKDDAVSQLFIDGKLIGDIRERAIAMNWDPEKTGIYVAVNYIGLLDELAIFRHPFSAAEVQLLFRQPGLLK